MKHALTIFIVLLMLTPIACVLPSSHAALSVIQGTVYWYDQNGNLHPLPWAQVTATDEDGGRQMVSSTTDGTYSMWVVPGNYNVSVSVVSGESGYVPQSQMVTVSAGAIAVVDFQLEPTGKPIPEFPPALQPLILLVASLVAIILIRRRKRSQF